MTTRPGRMPEEGLYFRVVKAILDPLIPDLDAEEPRLFPREATYWSLVVLAGIALDRISDNPFPHPLALIPAAPAAFVFMLYMGLYKWIGPGRCLLWIALPGGAALLPLFLARDGTSAGVYLPISAGLLVTSVLTAEWMRRRAERRLERTSGQVDQGV